MRNILLTLLLSVLARPLLAQGAPPQAAPDQPYTMEYYYKAQWGHQQEFLQLFLKNHYPLLRKMVESGRMISVKIETPANHMTEDARWDYRVTIRFNPATCCMSATGHYIQPCTSLSRKAGSRPSGEPREKPPCQVLLADPPRPEAIGE